MITPNAFARSSSGGTGRARREQAHPLGGLRRRGDFYFHTVSAPPAARRDRGLVSFEARVNHVVSPSPNALGPGFQMKPSPKHVAVTAFKVGTEGYTHELTSIDGDRFFANKPTWFKSTRFFFKLGFGLPRHCVGYLAVAKYTYRTPRATPGG